MRSRVDTVHDIRTTSARIRVWLELVERPHLRARLGRIRRAAGELRDRQLLLASDPPRVVVARTTRALARAEKRFAQIVRDEDLKELLARAVRTKAPSSQRVLAYLDESAHSLRKRLKRACARPRDLEALHDVRRGVRRLRYLLAWSGHKDDALERLHDTLGAVGDCVASLALLDAHGGAAERAFRRRIERRLALAWRRATAVLTRD